MTAPIALPSRELVRSFLDYNPETGIFTWLKSPSDSVRVGAVAGSIRATGYRTVSLLGGKFQAHRLAWLWMTGDDPAELNVDHINGARDDNRWSNLRLATAGQNSANSERQRNNLSGFKGVSQNNGKWKACITANGKDYYLGVFDTKELASAAYVAKANELHGEYASGGRTSSAPLSNPILDPVGRPVAVHVRHDNKKRDPSYVSGGGGESMFWGSSLNDWKAHVERLRGLDHVVTESVQATFLYAAPMQGVGVWQAIETAPKDGSMMLISVGDRGGVGEAWFSRSDTKWYWASGDAAQLSPTHWMPLPPPPRALTTPLASTDRVEST